jgi:hypothetical protein
VLSVTTSSSDEDLYQGIKSLYEEAKVEGVRMVDAGKSPPQNVIEAMTRLRGILDQVDPLDPSSLQGAAARLRSDEGWADVKLVSRWVNLRSYGTVRRSEPSDQPSRVDSDSGAQKAAPRQHLLLRLRSPALLLMRAWADLKRLHDLQGVVPGRRPVARQGVLRPRGPLSLPRPMSRPP